MPETPTRLEEITAAEMFGELMGLCKAHEVVFEDMMASICGTAIGPSFVALEQSLTTLLTERQDVWRA